MASTSANDTVPTPLSGSTAGYMPTQLLTPAGNFSASGTAPYYNEDGFDLVWIQAALQTQMNSVESDIETIENNANLSDTEKMYSMQMAMNTWSAISTLRTNILKSVSDTLQGIVRNVTT